MINNYNKESFGENLKQLVHHFMSMVCSNFAHFITRYCMKYTNNICQTISFN